MLCLIPFINRSSQPCAVSEVLSRPGRFDSVVAPVQAEGMRKKHLERTCKYVLGLRKLKLRQNCKQTRCERCGRTQATKRMKVKAFRGQLNINSDQNRKRRAGGECCWRRLDSTCRVAHENNICDADLVVLCLCYSDYWISSQQLSQVSATDAAYSQQGQGARQTLSWTHSVSSGLRSGFPLSTDRRRPAHSCSSSFSLSSRPAARSL